MADIDDLGEPPSDADESELLAMELVLWVRSKIEEGKQPTAIMAALESVSKIAMEDNRLFYPNTDEP